ncbi:hypothetical protein QZH41_004911 [Actinostola sp. cb2023]|nr:hypothetical protein QZH41_004911 [Actinostola sp. cb2023]
MRSDNGGNFVKGERELREAIRDWNQAQIHDYLLQRNIKWTFNPPAGSHHGGVWERCIRTVRKVMKAVVREQTLDDEGLNTLMCEAESIINSRPLTKLSDDPRDMEPLTPNHLLLLHTGPTTPPGTFSKHDNYTRRRWRQVQYLADVFWKRWIREYLPSLQERQKWNKEYRNFQVNDIVLVLDENSPRCSWPLGRILEVYNNRRDGLVRSVKLKTRTTILVRPIDKIVLLEAATVSTNDKPALCDSSEPRSKVCNNTNQKHCTIPCEITANRSRAGDASTLIIHARDPKPLPPAKYSHIPLTLFTWENPVYTPMLYNPTFLAHFTYLLSYRPDVADFFLPSFYLPSLSKPIPFSNKTGLIAAAFSNCETARTAYLKELMKHIHVDSYGACLRNKEGLQDLYIGNFKQAKIKLLRNYKYTIVFHNQDCDYFVDDQLTHALDAGTIPVYMGTEKVNELLGGNLQNSIIKVRDFATPKKLAEYLLLVSNNEPLYNGYLKWKYEGFHFPESFLVTPQGRAWQFQKRPIDYCQMCEDIANSRAKGKIKGKGMIKPDYCKTRKIKDWLNI